MLDLRGKLPKNLIIFVLASLAFMSILEMGISMETKDEQCPVVRFFGGQGTMCEMSVTEHIAKKGLLPLSKNKTINY